MVTGGSWRGRDAVRSCAAAGSIRTAEEAVAENIRNKTLRTAMPPHVYCYKSESDCNHTQPGILALAGLV